MNLLRELAALLIEAANYLERGTAWDAAWAVHLRTDALALEQLAQVDRHAQRPPSEQ